MNDIRQDEKKKNQGFSLITVIVAVSFVGIMGMLVIYISMANFQMKVTDLKGKDSFYTAEQALEEIRTKLQEVVGESMLEAYIDVLEHYDISGKSEEVSLEEFRQNKFRYNFVNNLCNELKDTDESKYSMDKLRSYVDMELYTPDSSSKEVLIVTNPDGKLPWMYRDNNGIVLKNIKVIYVDEKGRASIIVTDIRLGIPRPEFPTAATVPDLMNLSVVAQSGILCNADKTTPAEISGIAYAGRLSEEDRNGHDLYGKNLIERASIWLNEQAGLTIKSGERFVSEGEILVKNGAKFEFTSGGELWAQGISAASETQVTLSGTTYLADDLTVEAGSGSYVKISGNYYGYGFADSAKDSLNYNNTAETQDRLYPYDSSSADLGSAIIINGKNTTMDLSEVHKLMLAGRTYISSKRLSSPSLGNKTNADVMTGESLTVKGTQIMYLVPPELLGTELDEQKFTNPMSYSEYLEYMGASWENQHMPVKSSIKVTAWGGKTLADVTGYPDSKDQVQEVFYNDNNTPGNGGGYVYFYLNFASDQKASAFMKDYYSTNEAVRENLNKYLSFYFGSNSGISIKDQKAFQRFVTNGNILSYDGDESKSGVTGATNASVSNELKEEQKTLQNTWYALNRKMMPSISFLNTSVKDKKTGLIDHNEQDPSYSVFDNMINVKELAGFVKDSDNKMKEFIAVSGRKALVCHNGSGSYSTYTNDSVNGENKTLVIGGNKEGCINIANDYSLIICTGDVELEAGIEFKGILMTKGKITLNNGSKLTSSSQDASMVFSAQEGDQVLRDIFWDGEDYSPGGTNSNDSENSSSTKDTYDLADFVTYENWKKQ